MFKKSKFLKMGITVLGLSSLAAASVALAQSTPQALQISACLAMNQTIEIVDCLNKTLDAEDDLLNQAYGNVVGNLKSNSAARVQHLKSAELAWIRFRDAQCKYDFTAGDGGDDSGVADMVCRISQTIKRRLDLEQEFVKLRKKDLY